jgi:hypothetical protein
LGEAIQHQNSLIIFNNLWRFAGGGGEIRTPETLTRPLVFETSAFNHSATPPAGCLYPIILSAQEEDLTLPNEHGFVVRE